MNAFNKLMGGVKARREGSSTGKKGTNALARTLEQRKKEELAAKGGKGLAAEREAREAKRKALARAEAEAKRLEQEKRAERRAAHRSSAKPRKVEDLGILEVAPQLDVTPIAFSEGGAPPDKKLSLGGLAKTVGGVLEGVQIGVGVQDGQLQVDFGNLGGDDELQAEEPPPAEDVPEEVPWYEDEANYPIIAGVVAGGTLVLGGLAWALS